MDKLDREYMQWVTNRLNYTRTSNNLTKMRYMLGKTLMQFARSCKLIADKSEFYESVKAFTLSDGYLWEEYAGFKLPHMSGEYASLVNYGMDEYPECCGLNVLVGFNFALPENLLTEADKYLLAKAATYDALCMGIKDPVGEIQMIVSSAEMRNMKYLPLAVRSWRKMSEFTNPKNGHTLTSYSIKVPRR